MASNVERSSPAGQPALTLRRLPGRYAICRLDHAAVEGGLLPEWVGRGCGFMSVTRMDDELSIVVDERSVPRDGDGLAVEGGWIAMRVVGKLDFALVGILARLTSALAAGSIPVCAISTYDTDVLLVKEEHAERAAEALAGVARVEPLSMENPNKSE